MGKHRRSPHEFQWGADAQARLRDLAAAGATASQIAAALSAEFQTITRNAVIGRASRTGVKLGRRVKPGAKPEARPVPIARGDVPAIVTPRRRKPRPLAAKAPEPKARGGHDTNGCKWVEGDPMAGQWTYCGAEREGVTAWCAHHRARVYTRGQQSTGRLFAIKRFI